MKEESGISEGEHSAEYKVPGGKLLRVHILSRDNIIKSIKITGDFFIHPEEYIDELEKLLMHTKLNEDDIRKKIKRFYDEDVIVIGADIEDFVTLIKSAFEPIGHRDLK